MKTALNVSLKPLNSFAVASVAPKIYFPCSVAELMTLDADLLAACYILGEGSNTLFCQPQSPPILKPCFKGIEVQETEFDFNVTVASGENWHHFVEFCIARGINGLENLALIPGSVGAAPVQNIGAYGVEVADFIQSVSWFDFEQKQVVELSNQACQFGYRDSVFKQQLSGKGVICSVKFQFTKSWRPVLTYPGLKTLDINSDAKLIMEQVVAIRQSKLPDPQDIANAGSFFKNPVVNATKFKQLLSQYPTMPYYPQEQGNVKLAAGWLIEHAQLKGYQDGNVAVHKQQALVLVNHGGACGQDLVNLAGYVRQTVRALFDISLIPEVRFIDEYGEFDPVEQGVV